ncbi:hypothetical protein [Paenibacillus sp. 481]|nr:hypothetical protein [Paenibacillus sp. 481]UHA75108.1 hypothetical protein KIK04_08840 [Paenibacillus sp. 481]
MIGYGFLSILFLFVVVKLIISYYHRKHTPAPEEIDRRLLAMLNPERDYK